MSSPRSVVLASTSKSRAFVLKNAGVPFTAENSFVDEDSVKDALRAENATAAHCAEVLAEMKAVKVSQKHPESLVIGGDQMLECDGRWFDKPTDLNVARTQLMALRGKKHQLMNSLVVALNGQRIWHFANSPEITVRDFSDAFLDDYLAHVGDAALHSVGGYQLEGLGAQLFTKIEGDFFSILGLPLLPLLAFLREHGILKK
ncbi:MAG: Maf family protein [Rhodospirillaceae bacterium]|nr:Maf family protein [Rhodospirillaceae bacterium]